MYRPKQLSVMQDFFVSFDFNLVAYCLNKYRKMDCFRKYSIGFFKIEKTSKRSSLVVKTIFHSTSCCEWGK